MGIILTVLGFALIIVGFVCSVIVLIDAFQSEIWKGVLYLICSLYGLYYMFVEFDHERKWQIIAGAFIGSIGGWVFLMMGGLTLGQ